MLGNPVPWLFAGWRQRSTLPLGAGVGGVVSTTGSLVVTQYRLLVVSLRVLADKDAAGGGSGVVVDDVPHPASPRVEQRSRPGNLGPVSPHVTAPPTYWGTPDLRKGLGRLDRPPTAATRPMVSPASAAPFKWVPAGGVEAAVVGRVVDGQARHAAVGGAVAAGRIRGWWAPRGADSAHRGLTVPAGSSSTSPVSADHRRPVLTAAYSTVLCTPPAADRRKPAPTWGNTAGAALHNIYYRTTATPSVSPEKALAATVTRPTRAGRVRWHHD